MSDTLAAVEAARLLLRRREVRRSMTEWARQCSFEPATHHSLLIRELEAVVHGDTRRLMVIMPPGAAKSTYSSVLFPPWYLAQRDGVSILACSHSTEKAEEFGRKARNLVSTHATDLGYDLCDWSKAAGRWETDNKSQYFAAGVGTAIAGYRADLGLIDDPVRNKEDADSKIVRDKIWDWYCYDFKTRLKPNASVILIMTRWHEDDLAGRILANEASDWRVIRIPLIAEEDDVLGRSLGEPLWPAWFNEKMIEDARTSPAFASLYQGRPAPEEGDYFKRDWLVEYRPEELQEAEKNGMRYYVGSDHAVGLKQKNDRTCLLPVGVDTEGNIWILPDIYWTRDRGESLVDEMLNLAARRRPIVWWAEAGHITKSIGPFLWKRSQERGIFIPIEEVVSSRDKPTRAQSIREFMGLRRVRFPSYAHWWPEARHELLTFFVGTHDDFIDALSEVGQGLHKIVKPRKLKVDFQETPLEDWKPTFGWLKESAKRREKELAGDRGL